MKFSRRRFLYGASALAICAATPASAGLHFHGTSGATGKSVINANFNSGDIYLNKAKAINFSITGSNTPAILNANQYPTGILPSDYASQVAGDLTYYGHYTLQWTGTSAFQILEGPVIVYSGGNGVSGVSPSASGTRPDGNTTWLNNGSQNCEFSFGALVTSVSGGSGSLVTITTPATNFGTGIPTNTNVKFGVGVSANLANGPNSDGSWTITNVNGTQFTLNGSTGVVSPTVTGAGGPGVQTEAIVSVSVIDLLFRSNVGGAVTHAFSNFIFCKTADLTDIGNGLQVSRSAVNAVKALNPKYVRFMDMMLAQRFYSDFNFRTPAGSLTYSGISQWVPSLYVSPMGGAGDAFTVPNPGYQTGSYVNGEIVQFTATQGSSTLKPTLNVGARGVAPIFNTNYLPLYLVMSGTPTTGDVVTITFTASYLPSGAYVFTYTVLAGDTTLSILTSSIATALANDGVLAGWNFQFELEGTAVWTFYAPSNGALVVTSSTSGSATETCNAGTQLVTTSIVSGSSYTCEYNTLLRGWVIVGDNSGLPSGVPLEVISELCTRANVGAWLCTQMPYTQASFNALGAWAATNLSGLPVVLEPMNEVWNVGANPTSQCNAQGACFGWPCLGAYFSRAEYSYYGLQVCQNSSAFATGYVGAGGTRSNLSLTLQCWAIDFTGNPSNGATIPLRWNGGLLTSTPGSASLCTISGTTLTVGGSVSSTFFFPGMVLAGAGVTVGTRIQKILTGSGGAGTYQLSVSQTVSSAVAMTAGNPLYTATGGPNGTAGTNYNAFPNRPIDVADSVGYACYIYGAQAGYAAATWSGTATWFANLFAASQQFAAGGGGIATALAAWDTDINSGALNGVTGQFVISTYTTSVIAGSSGYCQSFENNCAAYDGAGRPGGKANLSVIQYEGGLSEALGSNANSGTSTTVSPAQLSAQFTANGWDLSPTGLNYGASNLAVATNLVNLFLAYVNSSNFAASQLAFYRGMATIHAARPSFSPAQYGLENGTSNTWAIYPGNLSTTPWQNFNGIAAFNH